MLVVFYGLFSFGPDVAVKHVRFHECTVALDLYAGACGIKGPFCFAWN